ncbi:MAG: enoyl-CoA hydratase/isomerase family protein [Chloroflexi bacterium]|nr:enoyl-CoA hydratase/isomerase family protein [Chloroflexota bacterium]
MPIDYSEDGAIVTIRINRPEARNALDEDDSAALGQAFERFRTDDHARVAILTGVGPLAFCAGGDLKRMLPARQLRVRAGGDLGPSLGGITRAPRIDKPLIAAINGDCVGGGLEIALCCDVRIAVPHARFGFPEIKWSILPGAGGTQRLPRTIGVSRATRLLLTGDLIAAEEALAWGLISQVVSAPSLAGEVSALATKLASYSPLALHTLKRAIYEGLEGRLTEGLRLEAELAAMLLRSADAEEGLQAFRERRAGEFRGI